MIRFAFYTRTPADERRDASPSTDRQAAHIQTYLAARGAVSGIAGGLRPAAPTERRR